MGDSELDALHAALRIEHDGGGPASNAIPLGYPLLRILHHQECQAEAFANLIDSFVVVAAMDRDDEGTIFIGLM